MTIPLAARLQASLSTPAFRPYASDDVIGVALGGAAKNVYAIACGVVEGLGLGENARAALLARSFAELARLGEALGSAAGNFDGIVRAGRSGAVGGEPIVAQFRLWVALGQRRGAERIVTNRAGPWPRAWTRPPPWWRARTCRRDRDFPLPKRSPI